MKMLWLGVLMFASFLLSFTGFIEADEDIPSDEDGARDPDQTDLSPPTLHDISANVLGAQSYHGRDLLNELDAEHKRIEEEIVAHMRFVAGDSEKALKDFSEEAIKIHAQDSEADLLESELAKSNGGFDHEAVDQHGNYYKANENAHDGFHEEVGKHDDYYKADDKEADAHAFGHSLHKSAEEDVMAHESDDDVQDGTHENVVHHKVVESAHFSQVVEGVDDVSDSSHENVVHHKVVESAQLSQVVEGVDDVRDGSHEHVVHHEFHEEELAHSDHVVDGADDVRDGSYENVIYHNEGNVEEEGYTIEDVNEDIIEAKYIGRYIHLDKDDELSDADVTERVQKLPEDEAMEDNQLKLKKVGLLRRSDRSEVEKGDNPNRTTRVYLNRVQDHLQLEEAHAIFEEDSEYIEKIVYIKPESPVKHKHKDDVKFVNHDEF